MARDAGLVQATARRYLNLLETTCLIDRIPAYAVNRTKRLVESPKQIFLDPGLAAYLSGYYDVDSLKRSKDAGSMFECLVYLHLKVSVQTMTPVPEIYHWRTTGGREVDFVIEWGRHLIAIEVKLWDRVSYSDLTDLRMFMEEYPEAAAGLIVYAGDSVKIMGEKMAAIPWQMLM
jgi:uncharacterized protein